MPMNVQDWQVYARYSQLGLEMVGPIILGLLVDYGLGTQPWATVIGAVLSLVWMLLRLQKLLQIEDRESKRGGP